jgi:hypothetical protein
MRSRGFFLLLALAIPIWGTGVLLAPSAMCGPEDKKGGQGGGGEAGKKKDNEQRAVRRALRMEEIEIHGDVEKPKTMFVIPRASHQYSRKDQEKDFTNEILDAITKEWVEDTQRWRVTVPPP